MKTVIEDDSNVGTTQMDCTSLPTIIGMAFGIGAEEEIQQIISELNDQAEAVGGLAADVQQEETAREQADASLSEQMTNTVTYIQQMKLAIDQQILTLTNRINEIAGIYPKVIMAGVISGNGSVERPYGSSIDLTDTRYAILITPEGGHEAWDITRSTDHFTINVWNRSGTSRVGYSGNINYTVIQKSAI